MKVRENRTAKQRRDLAKSATATIPPPARPRFDYAERAALARQAHQAFTLAVKVRSNGPDGDELHQRAVARFRQAIEEAYPPRFWEKMPWVRVGDLSGIEEAIRFLEADPYFSGSGYAKRRLIRWLKPVPLDSVQIGRLHQVVLNRIDRWSGREFPEYARLARRFDSPDFRAALEIRLNSDDPNVVQRARHVLAVCDNDGAFFNPRRPPR